MYAYDTRHVIDIISNTCPIYTLLYFYADIGISNFPFTRCDNNNISINLFSQKLDVCQKKEEEEDEKEEEEEEERNVSISCDL